MERKVWVVPAERTKSKRRHRVPLSGGAVATLAAVTGLDKTYVFPGHKRSSQLSNAAILQVPKRLKREYEEEDACLPVTSYVTT